ncbi:tetratricopeptide repeat protein [Candidatus Methylopumilus turicensis]|uniref:Tetratricopeptide domain protein n=1 Tax=Candidatus Methylopumilus turicensis TaxID=1581680 RepID=A0A0B7IWJ4_9PROT|nr:tetratricopeptide repeat protein [Candidatus Methylopumilus turicensis]CEN55457.1 Tetratricopeptide domain protein [Candidatus Methylopumilus turicensis]
MLKNSNLLLNFKKKSLLVAISIGLYSITLAPCAISAEAASKPVQTEANAEFVFKYLAAEVAGQKGELGISTQLFYDLAKSSRDVRLAERAAKVAMYSKNAQAALETAKLWVELDANSTEAQQTAAQIYVINGDLIAAKPLLQKLLENTETQSNSFLYLNNLFSHQANRSAVLQLVQDLAAPYPQLAEAHFTLAQAAFQADNLALALTESARANQLKPHWEIAAIQQADILYTTSPEQAIGFYRNFLNDNADANDARLNLARMLIKQSRFNEAKPELVKLTKLAPQNPEILVVVGLLFVQSNQFNDAEKYFLQALDSEIKNKDPIYLYLGQIAEKNKNDTEAINWYNKVQQRASNTSAPQNDHYLDAKLSAANVIARSQGADIAIKMLDDLENLSDIQLAQVITAQANILAQSKRYQESYELLGKAVANMPNTNELIYEYAMAAERVQQYSVLETQLRLLIKIKPNFVQAYNALGYSFADRNVKLEEANKLIAKALELSPGDHYIMDSMGWVQYRLGNLDKAYEFLNKAYNLQNDSEIAAHLGEVLWKQGKHDEANKIWDEGIKASPQNEVILKTIKKFKP